MSKDFSTVHGLYQKEILHYCIYRSRNKELGEDLAQETFFRFWMCLERNDDILHARPFLYRIAHNLLIDHSRKKKETSLDQLQEAGFEPSVDLWYHTENRLDAARPMRQMLTLQKPYREVLQQRFLQGLHPAEIAQITGESSNAISVRIVRGLKHLRASLKVASPAVARRGRY